jgi:hypothetical protein
MKKSLVLFIVFLFAITACSMLPGNSPEPTVDVQAAIKQTIDVQNAIATAVVQTQMAGLPTATLAAIPANPVPPSAVQAPTEQPTAAPEAAEVKVSAITNANCRSGPAANFGLIGKLVQGDSAVVIGKNTDFGKWWMVVWQTIRYAGSLKMRSPLQGTLIRFQHLNHQRLLPLMLAPTGTAPGRCGFQGHQIMTIKMVQNGNKLTYSFKLWGLNFTAYLTLNSTGMTASGSLVREEGGTWSIILNRAPENLDQFRGRWYDGGNTNWDGQMCGATDGAPMPDPCRP